MDDHDPDVFDEELWELRRSLAQTVGPTGLLGGLGTAVCCLGAGAIFIALSSNPNPSNLALSGVGLLMLAMYALPCILLLRAATYGGENATLADCVKQARALRAFWWITAVCMVGLTLMYLLALTLTLYTLTGM